MEPWRTGLKLGLRPPKSVGENQKPKWSVSNQHFEPSPDPRLQRIPSLDRKTKQNHKNATVSNPFVSFCRTSIPSSLPPDLPDLPDLPGFRSAADHPPPLLVHFPQFPGPVAHLPGGHGRGAAAAPGAPGRP